jgi:Lar family restriction alleviation protein
MTGLLPCPFCATDVEILPALEEDPGGWLRLACAACGACGPRERTRGEAAEAWNCRRSPAPKEPPP